MTRRARKSRSKRKAARSGRARLLVTLLLFVVIGFFGVSIYLGRVSSRRSSAEEGHAQNASLVLPERAVPTVGSPTLIIENGCGRSGLGAGAERWLRRQGFDVFETRNADRMDYEQTLVIARSSRAEAARTVVDRLQRTLGIGQLIEQRTKIPEADVLLILGKDFPDSLPAF